MKSPEIDQKSLLATPSYHDESCRVVEEIPLEEYLVLLLCLGSPGLKSLFSDPDVLQRV